MLFALLLLTLSISALLNYQRALTHSAELQWQQRSAMRVASQRLLGHEVAGWRTQLQLQTIVSGCRLEQAEVSGPYQVQTGISRLRC